MIFRKLRCKVQIARQITTTNNKIRQLIIFSNKMFHKEGKRKISLKTRKQNKGRSKRQKGKPRLRIGNIFLNQLIKKSKNYKS